MSFKIYLSPPNLGGEELNFIKKAFSSNWITTFGNNLNNFEKALENYYDNNFSVAALNSGTSAIHLALILAGVKPNDEVVCPTMTFVATANPILYQKANPIFIDSETDTWNLNPDILEETIKERLKKGKTIKAIILCHSYGMPAKIDQIINISKLYNIPIIEDAAAALGSSYKNQKCGTFGKFGIISFNGNKIITTSSGGALICKEKSIKEKAINLATQAKQNKPFYEHSELGFNYRMSNILAGIGLGQIKVLNNYIESRRNNHDFYKSIFKNLEGITFLEEPDDNYFSNHWLTCILIEKQKTGFSNKDLKNHLEKNKIESRYLWNPLHLQPLFKAFPYYGEKEAENLFSKGLCLPSSSNLSLDQKKLIKEVLINFINKSE